MHFNYFRNNLSSNAKVFADDTPLFSVVFSIGASAKELNDNLSKAQYWASHLKIILTLANKHKK